MAERADKISEKIVSSVDVPLGAADEQVRLEALIARSQNILKPKVVHAGGKNGRGGQFCNFKIGMITRDVTCAGADGDVAELRKFEPQITVQGMPTDKYYRLLAPLSVIEIERARVELTAEILQLAERGANVICVSELGYPAFSAPETLELNGGSAAELSAGDVVFRAQVQGIADKYRTHILCGTHHDARTIQNNAIFFVPGETEQFSHQKITSAKSESVGEVIRTPSTPTYHMYETELGLIAILICMDAYDLNVMCRYIFSGLPGTLSRQPDLVLVPAWSPVPLVPACKDISYFGRTAVVYVNNGSLPYSHISVGGCEVHSSKKDVAFFELDANERDLKIIDALAKQRDGLFSKRFGTTSRIL